MQPDDPRDLDDSAPQRHDDSNDDTSPSTPGFDALPVVIARPVVQTGPDAANHDAGPAFPVAGAVQTPPSGPTGRWIGLRLTALVLLILVVALVFQSVVVSVISDVAFRGDTKAMGEGLGRLGMVLVSMGSIQLVLLAFVLYLAVRGGGVPRQRLGLLPTPLKWGGYALLVLGSLFVAAAAQFLALPVTQFYESPAEEIATMRQQFSPSEAVAFVLFIALAPGVIEELLMRGYVQRRLLEHRRP